MKYKISGFLLVCFSFVFSQSFQLRDSIMIESRDSITDFGSDDFDNIYFIQNFNELIKINLQTGQRKTFSNHTILENLNTQNVLQITLKSGFFKLLVLDNQLNKVQDEIEFPMETNFSPTLTALVDNNYLWGYDPVLQRLVLWNYRDQKALRQSVILSEKTGDEYFPELIYHQNKIYLIGFNKILKFDDYANLEKVIPFNEFKQLNIQGENLYYSVENQLFKLNLKSLDLSEIDLNTGFDYFSINNRYLFVLKDKVVYIYDFHKNL